MRNGNKILVFDYICIKLWLMAVEELLAFDQPALLPLTLLTKGGANRIIVDRMFDGLFASGLHDLLPVGNLLDSLVLGKEDLEWLKRRYKQMTDILKDTPAYHWMTEDAREEGREQGIERGREQERQAAQEAMLNQLREMTMEIIIGRFPKFVRLAKKQVRDAKDLGRLQRALVKVSLAHDDDDIEPYLWEIDEEEDQTVH